MQWINIMGRLATDPETRFTANNQKVTSFRMAANRKRAGKEEATWYKVTIWGDQFDKILAYFKKGSGVIVAGEFMQPEIYMDRDGKPQISLQINAFQLAFMPSTKPAGEKLGDYQAQGGAPASTGAAFAFPSFDEVAQGSGQPRENSNYLDEEIPF